MTSSGTGAELAFDYANNHLEFSDNTKATFGTSNDLEIYHDGSDSFISDQGTGALKILTNSVKIKNAADNEQIANFTRNDSVELYYDNSLKFETKTDGVDITGELQCDSLDVDGAADITGNVTLHANLDLQDSDRLRLGTSDDLQIYHDGSNSYISESGTAVLKISSNQTQILRVQVKPVPRFKAMGQLPFTTITLLN